jgi:riboflavin synthase
MAPATSFVFAAAMGFNRAMFTGIVETVGKIAGLTHGRDSVRLTVSAGRLAEENIAIGDSVAVSGVCLTVVEIKPPQLVFEAVYETLRRTSLGERSVGDAVNLERALIAGGRLGGHIVQGHVDGTGRIASIRPIGDSWFIYVDASPELLRYVVNKGSICVDGISLTVVEASDRTFSLSVIPHTWENTTLRDRKAGDVVNIECDVIGKYVERLLGGYIASGGEVLGFEKASRGVTMELLERAGFTETTGEATKW